MMPGKDFNILLGPATECEVVGSIVKDGKQLNLKNLSKVKKSPLSNKTFPMPFKHLPASFFAPRSRHLL